MSDKTKERISIVKGIISSARSMGSLPDAEEGLCKLEDKLSYLASLSPNQIEEEKLILLIDDMETLARTTLRLAKQEAVRVTESKNKWRLK